MFHPISFGFELNTWCSKKSKLQSFGLAPSILEHLMPLTTEEEPEDVDEDAPSRVCYHTNTGQAITNVS